MIDALQQIRRDLDETAKSRTRRGLVVTLLAVALMFAYPMSTGFRAADAQVVIAFAVTIALIALGVINAFAPAIRIGTPAAVALMSIALLSPLITADSFDFDLDRLRGALPCAMFIAIFGVLALIATRAVLADRRRRFGGASELLAVACAMIGAVAVGLHCPVSSIGHLAGHIAAALVVTLVARRLVFR
jgi:hypothetical protein